MKVYEVYESDSDGYEGERKLFASIKDAIEEFNKRKADYEKEINTNLPEDEREITIKDEEKEKIILLFIKDDYNEETYINIYLTEREVC